MTTSSTPRLDDLKTKLETIQSLAPTEEDSELIVDKEAREIYLFGTIGSEDFGRIGSKSVTKALKQFKGRGIRLIINSVGGQIDEAAGIYNAIKRHPGGVIGVVDGQAASAASYILMACTFRLMRRNSAIMIHDPWSQNRGNASDMSKQADLLKRFGVTLAEGYARASGKSLDEITKIMAAETWYFGAEAIEAGFCTGWDDGEVLMATPRRREARNASLRVALNLATVDCDSMIAAMQR